MTDSAGTSRRDAAIVVSLTVIFFLISIAFGILSDGVHHDDDLTHFMFARWSWWYPGYLVHTWGRPGFTIPTAMVAWIGDRQFAWHLARALSALVTLGGALIATLLARQYGLRYWRWTIVLCFVQPMNMLLSYTTLTENFTALYLVGGLLLLHRRRPAVASVVFSLAFVSRLETIVLLPVWWVCVAAKCGIRERRVRLAWFLLLALWAPAMQNVLHFAAFGTWPVGTFFRPSGSTEYLATGPLAYLPPLLLAMSPLVAGLAALGVIPLLRRGYWDVVTVGGAYLGTHWLITWLGVFASGGFARFAVAAAPLAAIAAIAGVELLVDQSRGRQRGGAALVVMMALFWCAMVVEMRAGRVPWRIEWMVTRWGLLFPCAGLIGAAIVVWRSASVGRWVTRVMLLLLVIGVVVQCAVMVRPLRLRREQRLAKQVAASLDSARPVFCANPWIAWFDGEVEDPRAHKGPRLLSSMPAGTIFIWDSIYSPSDFHQLSLERYSGDSAYRLLQTFGGKSDAARFEVFEKTAKTAVETGGHPYPLPLTLGRGERLGVYYECEAAR